MGSVVSSVSNLAGGIFGASSGSSQQSDLNKLSSEADPFAKYRGTYAGQLNDLMKDPSKVTSLPGYQFQYEQGLDALTRTSAATGYTGSGNEAIALQKYGQDYAKTAFTNYEQMLAQLSGASQSPASGAGTAANILNSGYSANNAGIGGLLGSISNVFGQGGGLSNIFGGFGSLFGGGSGAAGGIAGGADSAAGLSDIAAIA